MIILEAEDDEIVELERSIGMEQPLPVNPKNGEEVCRICLGEEDS